MSEEMKEYFLSDKLYTILKWTALIAFPSIATFIGVIGAVWGWAGTDAIVTTINAVGALIGALIGASAATSRQGTSDSGKQDEQC